MARLLAYLLLIVVAAFALLALVWLVGQILTGVGLFLAGAAGVLGRTLLFLLLAALLGGVAYFLASAYRRS
ncbi:hypothetical protein [Deinococcus maricopensis]|nr:hypothetical protein [Deinococcus maricopensis]